MMKRTLTAAAVMAALSIGGLAFAATAGGGSQRGVPDHDPRSPNYHNPADDDPRSPGYIRAHSEPVHPSPDDEFACGYKYKDLPAFGYHPPYYVDDEGVGPSVIVNHNDEEEEEEPGESHRSCHVVSRDQAERNRQYIREHPENLSGEVVE